MSRSVICRDCNNEKPHHAKGLCNTCYRRQYCRANREKVKAYHHRWREKNREKWTGYTRRWRKENPGYDRRYREGHREKRAIYNYYWAKKNPEKAAAKQARRKACRMNVANTAMREQVEFERKVGEATYPGQKLHLHHIVPISKGGGHTWGNIAFIPAALNQSINDRLPEEAYTQASLI